MAADVAGLITAHTLQDPSVPTNAESATVRVTNQGNQRTNTVSQVAVYASLDATFDAADILLGTANAPQRINAGSATNVVVPLSMPGTLQPVTYNLLARVDATNVIAEGAAGEANNLSVGPQFEVEWQFGAVPGRTGNTVLNILDADGTRVTFTLTGPGTGEVIRDGATWDVHVTGTTSASAVTILTNSAGNGRVTLNDIHVQGPLAALTAATTDITGTVAVDGPVTALTLGSVQGGVVAAPSITALTIGIPFLAPGHLTNATILIGANLGQDGKLGGAGVNADTFGPGQLGSLILSGAMTNSTVRVGVDPVDGAFGNGNDVIRGGSASSITLIAITGQMSSTSRIIAGALPATALVNGASVNTATDPRFSTDVTAPALAAALAQDTGSDGADGYTSLPTVTGNVTDSGGIAAFTAGFGATPAFSILADRQADGSFALPRTRLEQINGGPLTDGTYVLKLQATDAKGNVSQTTVSFTLDTAAPPVSFDLAPTFDTPPVGDQATTADVVTLIGLTEPLAALLLLETGQTTTADASGTFSFTNVALNLGANSLTIRATDRAGNQNQATRTITRTVADSDGDGIPDANEGGGPNGGDANQDGIPDSQQANVTSLVNAVTNEYVTLVSPTGTTLRNVQTSSTLPADAPAGVDFPFGQIGFEVHGVAPGGSAQVTFLLPTGSLVNSFYKYGPEPLPGNTTAHWYDFAFDAVSGTGATINGDTITLSLIDGARGDADLTANGVIVDPGAPAVTTVRWTGLGNDRNWRNPANWSGNRLPGATNDVVIPDGVTIGLVNLDDPAFVPTIKSLTMGPSTTLNLDLPFGFVVGAISGGAINAGNLTLIANGPAQVDSLQFRGGRVDFNSTAYVGTLNLGIFDPNDPGYTGLASAPIAEVMAQGTMTIGDLSLGGGAGVSGANVILTGQAVVAYNFFATSLTVAPGAFLEMVDLGVNVYPSTFGSVLNEGTWKIAVNRPLTLTGDYTQTGTGLLQVGVGAQNEFGIIQVGGTATLAGTLTMTGPSDTTDIWGFPLMTVTSHTGSFTTVNLPVAAPGQTFTIKDTSATSLTFMVDAELEISIADAGPDNEFSVAPPPLQQVFVVSLNVAVPAGESVTVDYATADETATAGSDYVATSGTLVFGPGERSKFIYVTWTDDGFVEPTETYVVVLSHASNATLADSQGRATILDNDVNLRGPSATEDSYTTAEDTPLVRNAAQGVLANDTDPDTLPANLTAQLSGQAQFGTVVLNSDGSFTYTPNASFHGTDHFSYIANDGAHDSAPATVTINVTPVDHTVRWTGLGNDGNWRNPANWSGNRLPGATNDVVIPDGVTIGLVNLDDPAFVPTIKSLTMGASTTFNLEAPLGFVVLGAITGGTINAAGSLALIVNGPADLASLHFGGGHVDFNSTAQVGTLNLGVFDPLDPRYAGLTAAPTAEVTAQGAMTIGDLSLGGGAGVSAPDLTLTGHGTVAYNFYPGSLTIAPGASLELVDLRLNVPSPPTFLGSVLNEGTLQLATGRPLTLSGDYTQTATGVLRVGVGAQNEFGTIQVGGTATLAGTLTVTGPADTADIYGFPLMTVASHTGTFSTINLPVAAPGQTFTIDDTSATSLTFMVDAALEISIADAGPDSEPSDVFLLDGAIPPDLQQLFVVSLNVAVPVGETVTVDYATVDETATAGSDYVATSGTLVFGPGERVKGIQVTVPHDLFVEPTETYVVVLSHASNATLADSQGRATILDNDVNLRGPSATEDSYTTAEDTPLVRNAAQGVLANDTDPDTLPANLTARLVGSSATNHGSVILNADGSFTYTPNPNFSGIDHFAYFVNDGVHETSSVVTITVTPVNDTPVAANQSVTTLEDTAVAITLTASDVENDALTYSIVTGPQHGTLTGTGASRLYTPAANYFGPDSFTFTVNDGQVDSNVATVTITVTAVNDAPELQPIDGQTVNEGALLTFTASATDPDGGQTLTFSLEGTVPAGAVIDPVTGVFTWTPTEAQGPGLYGVMVRVTDDGAPAQVAEQLVSITVREVNNFAPVANPDSLTTPANTPLIITGAMLVGNDTDGDGDALYWIELLELQASPQFGTLTGNATGIPSLDLFSPEGLTYTPIPGFEGTEILHYRVGDRVPVVIARDFGVPYPFTYETNLQMRTAVGILTITVGDPANANHAPTLAPIGNQTIGEEVLLTFTAIATDPDAGQLLQFSLSNGVNGQVPIGATIDATTGVFTWTPTEAQGPGSYTFDVVVTDTGVPTLSARETITVSVTETNGMPILALIGNQAVDEGQELTFTARATDPDAGQTSTFSLEGTVPAGAVIDPVTGVFTWTPTEAQGPGLYGVMVRVTDDGAPAQVAEQLVSITVREVNNFAPVANPDSLTTPANTPLIITGAMLVGNDTDGDVDGDGLYWLEIETPRFGTLTGNATGIVTVDLFLPEGLTYTPNAGFEGTETLFYRMGDRIPTLRTEPPGYDPNILHMRTAVGILTITVGNPTVNDAPVASNQSVTMLEDTATSITLSATDIENDPLTFSIVNGPQHGTLSGSGATRTYTPAANYFGPDSFTFTVNDGTLDSNVATVTIDVTPVNDAPLANDQSVTTAEDAALAINLSASDIDNDSLTYSIMADPQHGTLSGTGVTRTYTPAPNYNGPDSFTFKANDGQADSNVATVTITVTPVNDGPAVVNPLADVTVLEDTTNTVIDLVGVTPVFADAETTAAALIYTVSSSAPSVVEATVDNTLDRITLAYQPNVSGTATITVTASDGSLTASDTFEVTVTPVNDAPVAANQSVTTAEDTAVAITLTGSDVENDALTYSIVTGPQHGTLTGTGASRLYTPALNYFGPDSFTFTVNDGQVDSNVATVMIDVTPVPDTVTWTGAAGDGLWSTAGNWDLGRRPEAGDDVVIGDSVTYSVAAGTLAVRTVTLGTGAFLLVEGGQLTMGALQSTQGTLVVLDGTVSVQGATNLKQLHMLGGQVHLSDTTLGQLTLEDGTLTGAGASVLYLTGSTHQPSHWLAGSISFGTVNIVNPQAELIVRGLTQPIKTLSGVLSNSGTLSIQAGNQLTVSGAFSRFEQAATGTLQLQLTGGASIVPAQLNVTNSASFAGTLEVTGSMPSTIVGSRVPVMTYALAVGDFATVTLPTGPIGLAAQRLATELDVTVISARVTWTGAAGDGLWSTAGNWDLGRRPEAGDDVVIGDSVTYSVAAGTLAVRTVTLGTGAFLLVEGGQLTMGALQSTQGTLVVLDGTVSVQGATNLKQLHMLGGQVHLSDTTLGQLTLEDGTLTGAGASVLYLTGSTHQPSHWLAGSISFGTVNIVNPQAELIVRGLTQPIKTLSGVLSNSGTLSIQAGNQLTVSGAFSRFEQAATGTLQLQLAAGASTAALSVIGTVNLNGSLEVSIGGTPTTGDRFRVITFASRTGAFSAITLPANFVLDQSDPTDLEIVYQVINHLPVANAQSVTTAEDTAVAITLTGSDVENDALTYSIIAEPRYGTLSGTGANRIYTPGADYFGSDSFAFTVNDGQADSNVATVSITITAVNDAPVASSQSVTTAEDTAVAVTLTGSDVENDALTYSIVTGPQHGTLSASGASRLYTPAANYFGPDSFTFTVNDGQVDSNVATVSITITAVNDAPMASSQSVTVLLDTATPITLTGTDVDVIDRLGFIIVDQPLHGTLAGSNANVVYTPAAGYQGLDHFTFKINDGQTDSNVATVSLAVTSFQGLGDLPGGIFDSRPSMVSGNGAVVIGSSETDLGSTVFRWTIPNGIEDLSSVIGIPPAQVRALSFNGSVLVGKSAEGTAFRWSQVDGFQIIAGEGSNFTAAHAVSSDGSIVVGGGYIFPFPPASAFRWTAATGAIRLDNLSGYDNSEAFAVSNDGNVIVGVSYTGPAGPYVGGSDQQAQAVRWVADGSGGFTVQALGDLPGGNVMSRASAVSADGTVIVGVSESDLGPEAFRWTATEGMQRLGDGALEGAFAISADGSVIVGGNQGNPFIWDQNNGVRSLNQVFFELGMPDPVADGWSILSLVGISADGRTIVGEAFNPQGDVEAWRAVLPVNAFAPEFVNAPANNYQVQAGQNISFTVSATDGDANQFVLYRLLGNVPLGVAFNGGTLSWDPTSADIGDHPFTIRAYDNGVPSRFTDAQFTITVTAPE